MRLGPRRKSSSPAAEAYARAELPALETPWRHARYAVVDLETTGLDPRRDEIISFASVPVDDGRVRVGEIATAIVRPRRMPRAETIRIHGLRAADLESAPPLEESLDLVLEALTGRILVANVAWVERRFLTAALKARGIELRGPVLDSDVLSQAVPDRVPDPEGEPLRVGGTSGPRQSREARRLGLPVHRPHHADGDALTAAQIFIAAATHLDRAQPQTVGSLVELSERGAR